MNMHTRYQILLRPTQIFIGIIRLSLNFCSNFSPFFFVLKQFDLLLIKVYMHVLLVFIRYDVLVFCFYSIFSAGSQTMLAFNF